jgi:F-type H+-transporting ATPase subunit delta
MLDSIIADRYAKSLFELAIETGKLEEVKNDMGLFLDLIRDSAEFRHFLISPVVRPDRKIKVIDEIVKGKVGDLTQKFYHLIASKRREKYLAGIANAFIEKYKEHHNIVTVEIKTVNPLSQALRDKIVSVIEHRRGITVDLIETIDQSLIGGFIVSTGDVRYDASLATSVKKLKKEFEENLYVREI